MIVYGINPVTEALRSSHTLNWVALAAGKDRPALRQIRHLASQRGIPVREEANLAALSGSRENQGACAEWDSKLVKPLPSALPQGPLILLDGLQDPQNFGAAVRVCECFGFRTVVYHSGDSCGVTPAAIKASAGALFHVDLFLCNLNRAIKRLQAAELPIFAMENHAEAVDLHTVDVPESYCLVVGSEGRGVRHNVMQAATLCRLPLQGKVNSLNVSCALSAALWDLRRRELALA